MKFSLLMVTCINDGTCVLNVKANMSFELRARWVEVTVMMFVLNTGFELQSIIAHEYEGVD